MHEIVTVIAKYFVAIPVLALIWIFIKLPRKQKIELVIYAVATAILTALIVKLGTSIHQDPRPFVRDGVTPYFSSSTDNGFPSDHTAFSAAIAFSILPFRRNLGIALAVLALVIGACRVIAGVHHGQDIIGGFIFAAVGAAIAYWLVRPYAIKLLSKRLQS